MDRQSSERADLLREIADQARLLDGENPNSDHPEDTILWVGVYAELLDLTSRLLTSMDAELARMGEAFRNATGDMMLIEQKQRRYRRRLTYWEARMRELDGPVLQLPEKKG